MRTGLVGFGVVLLVLGAVFFYMPIATTATAATTTEEGTTTKSVQAAAAIPPQLSIASMIAGVLLIMLGLVIPEPRVYIAERAEEEPEHGRREAGHRH
ncbi:hypothetical protein HYX08_02850 [Candidatus Woesearchaeota archaeon]|nr:hypothetical protein [Candidatus Woesearchaeota archaeon]